MICAVPARAAVPVASVTSRGVKSKSAAQDLGGEPGRAASVEPTYQLSCEGYGTILAR